MNMPTVLALQISRRCNLTCRMCGWMVWQRNRGVMSPEIFAAALAEAQKNNIPRLVFSSAQGEPLLSPHCGEFIHRALDAGFELEINTNCTTLSDRNIDALVQAAANPRFTIQASFSGYDKPSHEAIYTGSIFEHTSRKLEKLARRLNDTGRNKNFWVNGIILDGERHKHLEFLASIGITERIKINQPDNFAGIVRYGGKTTLRKLGDLRMCPVLTFSMGVYDDGTVTACACRDSEGVMKLGHISEGLHALRNSEQYQSMLGDFTRRDLSNLPLCQGCDIPYGDV